MDDDFDERIEALIEQTGTGSIVGTVIFDQSYAMYQHEDLTLRHPRGGSGKYLSLALQGRTTTAGRRWAEALLGPGGLVEATIQTTEEVAKLASAFAPIEFGDLRESDHVIVRDKGARVYERLPIVPRLPDDVLIAKMEARHLWGKNE